MKAYDYTKAIAEIEKAIPEGLESAVIGMSEDWFWTGETLWENGEFKLKPVKGDKLGGIDSSYWATPELRLYFKGVEGCRSVPCYTIQEAEARA